MYVRTYGIEKLSRVTVQFKKEKKENKNLVFGQSKMYILSKEIVLTIKNVQFVQKK